MPFTRLKFWSAATSLALVVTSLVALGFVTQTVHAGETSDAQPDVGSARVMVRTTLDQVLEVLAEPDWTSQQRVSAIEQIAYARFDFDLMSKLVLGKSSYKKFNKTQLSEFETEFKFYLSRTYGGRVDNFGQPDVKIIGDRALKRGHVLVQTEISASQTEPIKMDYVLRDLAGEWKVIDVVIEGVSLVKNFRSQFKEIVNGEGGPEGLLQELRNKNAARDAV